MPLLEITHGSPCKSTLRCAVSYLANPNASALQPGDPLTYNGTDNLILNPVTGLIDQVDSAQDLITLFHNLGFTSIPV
jgi:hypothetical protein